MRSSLVERFSDKEEVHGSIPCAPTMSEKQDLEYLNPEATSTITSSLFTFTRRNLVGEFAEVFDSGDDIGLPEAIDTLNDDKGNRLGRLTATRIIRPESKDFSLAFIPENDFKVDSEFVSLRIPRYSGSSTSYYEYTKIFKSVKESKLTLRSTKKAEEAIKSFGLKVGKMLGVSEEKV